MASRRKSVIAIPPDFARDSAGRFNRNPDSRVKDAMSLNGTLSAPAARTDDGGGNSEGGRMNGIWRGLAVALAMTLAVWTAVAEGRQGGGGAAARPGPDGRREGGGGYGGGGRGHGGWHGHGHGHGHGQVAAAGTVPTSESISARLGTGAGLPTAGAIRTATLPYGYPYGYPYAGEYGYPSGASSDASITYVERQPSAPAGGGSWYYCQDPAGYYPYVSSCNQPWMAVQPFSTGGAGLAPAQ